MVNIVTSLNGSIQFSSKCVLGILPEFVIMLMLMFNRNIHFFLGAIFDESAKKDDEVFRTAVGCHSYFEFICTLVLFYPEDII